MFFIFVIENNADINPHPPICFAFRAALYKCLITVIRMDYIYPKEKIVIDIFVVVRRVFRGVP